MKYIHTKILLSAALSLIINCCFAQSDSTTKANEIIKLEQKLCDASPGDAVTWGKYLDPKWHIIAEDGSNMFKDEYLIPCSFSKRIFGQYQGHKTHTKLLQGYCGNYLRCR